MNDMLCHKKKESMSMVCYVIKKGVYVNSMLCYKKNESMSMVGYVIRKRSLSMVGYGSMSNGTLCHKKNVNGTL